MSGPPVSGGDAVLLRRLRAVEGRLESVMGRLDELGGELAALQGQVREGVERIAAAIAEHEHRGHGQ